MARAQRRYAAPPAALIGLVIGLAHLCGFSQAVLPAVPLLLLLVSLLLGHYPGCEAAVRLSQRTVARPRQRPAAERSSRLLPPRSSAPSGGLLIAFGRAQRPPPLAS